MTTTALVLRRDDTLACRAWIQRHSKSFFLSSLLLPARVRQASWALYAFCRRADDAVDEGTGGSAALRRVERLRRRLAHIYSGRADDDPIDRAFFAVVARYDLPAALPAALLDGMEMDARGVRYRDDDDLLRYCFRVAATVGLMMTQVMGATADVAYLRAADLGVAMQLTNIARDVGEDVRRGRVYLPEALCDQVGLDPRTLPATKVASPAVRAAVRALLERAQAHYRAADHGLLLLPRDCRFAITASRRIYSAIGAAVARNGYDSITQRAFVSLPHKLWLVGSALPAWISPTQSTAPSGPADGALRPLLRELGLPA